jgi:DMSO/TMAO reductase YedYZ heme-binding membrane subunit
MLSTVWFNLLFLIGLILNVMLFHLPIDSNETSREKFGGQRW